MNLRKNLGRVATTLLATAMLASVATVPAFAEGTTTVTVPIKKVINIGSAQNVKVPNTAVTFTVDEGTATTENNVVINAGVENAVYFAEDKDTITFSPDDTEFTKATELTVDTTKFTAPGVYRYDVKETKGDYDGMEYDETTHHLDVYVTNKDEGEGFDFAYIFDGKAYGENEGKTDGSITNTYTTYTVTVGKTVEGNQGDSNKPFEFEVTVNGAEGEKYTLVADGVKDPFTLTSGSLQTITLKDGQSFVIYGLSENDTYTVEEISYATDGYTTSYDAAYVEGNTRTDKDVVPGNKLDSVVVGTDSDSVMFYNYKDASTPTGLAMDIAPYALLVVVAVAGCFVFLRKRNED